MFNKKTTEAYRNIKAPDTLREKVLAVTAARGKQIPAYKRYPAYAFAASFAVLLLCVGVYLNLTFWTFEGEVRDVNGIAISELSHPLTIQTVEFQAERQVRLINEGDNTDNNDYIKLISERCVFLSVNANKGVEIKVDMGSILIFDSEKQSYVNAAQDVYIKGDADFYWRLPDSLTDAAYSMTIISGKNLSVLTVVYDSHAGTYAASYIKK